MDFRAIVSNGAYPTPTPPTGIQRAALGVSYGLLMGPLVEGTLFTGKTGLHPHYYGGHWCCEEAPGRQLPSNNRV